MFKHLVRSHRRIPFEKFAKILIEEYEDEFPDFVLLEKIALTIPVSSVPCERGFSTQNAIKSKERNRLSHKRLNRLMFIKLVGPVIEKFNFVDAVEVYDREIERRRKEEKPIFFVLCV